MSILFIITDKEQSNAPRGKRLGDIGIDLFPLTIEDIVLQPHETKEIRTGVRFLIPHGYWLQIVPQRSFALQGIIANVDIIENTDTNECTVILSNNSTLPQSISKDSAIAQMIVQRDFSQPTHEEPELLVRLKLIHGISSDSEEQQAIEAIIKRKEKAHNLINE